MAEVKKGQGDLKAALEQASAVRPVLSIATDMLNDKLAEAEKAIAGLKLGVWAKVELWPDEEGDTRQWLAFAKSDKDWVLRIEEVELGDQDAKIIPLKSAPRHIRVEAANRLTDLVHALVEEVRNEIGKVEAAYQTTEAFTEALTDSGGADE